MNYMRPEELTDWLCFRAVVLWNTPPQGSCGTSFLRESLWISPTPATISAACCPAVSRSRLLSFLLGWTVSWLLTEVDCDVCVVQAWASIMPSRSRGSCEDSITRAAGSVCRRRIPLSVYWPDTSRRTWGEWCRRRPWIRPWLLDWSDFSMTSDKLWKFSLHETQNWNVCVNHVKSTWRMSWYSCSPQILDTILTGHLYLLLHFMFCFCSRLLLV